MYIRNMTIEDYDQVAALWVDCGFILGISDSREEIQKFLEYNPGTSLLLIEHDKIAGSVLGGYDGRRGLVHHLAVLPGFQKKGYGRVLIEALEKEYKKLGVIKTSFWVLKSNLDVIGFYEKLNYRLREDLVTLSKVYT